MQHRSRADRTSHTRRAVRRRKAGIAAGILGTFSTLIAAPLVAGSPANADVDFADFSAAPDDTTPFAIEQMFDGDSSGFGATSVFFGVFDSSERMPHFEIPFSAAAISDEPIPPSYISPENFEFIRYSPESGMSAAEYGTYFANHMANIFASSPDMTSHLFAKGFTLHHTHPQIIQMCLAQLYCADDMGTGSAIDLKDPATRAFLTALPDGYRAAVDNIKTLPLYLQEDPRLGGQYTLHAQVAAIEESIVVVQQFLAEHGLSHEFGHDGGILPDYNDDSAGDDGNYYGNGDLFSDDPTGGGDGVIDYGQPSVWDDGIAVDEPDSSFQLFDFLLAPFQLLLTLFNIFFSFLGIFSG